METYIKIKKSIITDKDKIKSLKKEVNKWKRGFEVLSDYYDSISDEEQPKVYNKLKRLKIYS